MLLRTMLGLKEDAFLVEGSFEGLEMNRKSLDYLNSLAALPAGAVEAALLLHDENGPAGAAFKNKLEGGDFWFVIPYPSARASRQQTEKLVKAVFAGGIVASIKRKKVDSRKFRRALREYLAISLAGEALCDCDKGREPRSFAYNEERNKRLGALVKKLAKGQGFALKTMSALEICCGNGMSTAAIKPLFEGVLSIDNDKCAICNGVYHGTLDPGDVMVVDAMALTKYVGDKYDVVVGLMLGTIYEFNKNIWRTIFEEATRALKDDGFLLLTVNKKEEMDFLASAFQALGIPGTVIDNRNSGDIYDGWAFFAVKKGGHFQD